MRATWEKEVRMTECLELEMEDREKRFSLEWSMKVPNWENIHYEREIFQWNVICFLWEKKGLQIVRFKIFVATRSVLKTFSSKFLFWGPTKRTPLHPVENTNVAKEMSDGDRKLTKCHHMNARIQIPTVRLSMWSWSFFVEVKMLISLQPKCWFHFSLIVTGVVCSSMPPLRNKQSRIDGLKDSFALILKCFEDLFFFLLSFLSIIILIALPSYTGQATSTLFLGSELSWVKFLDRMHLIRFIEL